MDERAKLSRQESEAIGRGRRGRNWALLIALVVLCLLFYAIAWVKMTKS
ncbi:MAG: hypothetical protein J2P47_05560 [Acetobacteraceae bacterium]|nr:hypothetical protein [Acetobacteraceae bacterium]